jgi:hypothetical protein
VSIAGFCNVAANEPFARIGGFADFCKVAANESVGGFCNVFETFAGFFGVDDKVAGAARASGAISGADRTGFSSVKSIVLTSAKSEIIIFFDLFDLTGVITRPVTGSFITIPLNAIWFGVFSFSFPSVTSFFVFGSTFY